MKKHTGAAHVVIFHHQVRNQEKADGAHQNLHTNVQGYARGIHRYVYLFMKKIFFLKK